MKQKKEKCLAVSLNTLEDPAVGDVMEILLNHLVAPVSSEGSIKIVGTVAAVPAGQGVCLVETRFRERRDDRESEGCAVGPYVYGADGKAVSYTQVIPATVTGTEEEPFAPVAAVLGTEEEPFAPVEDTSDVVKLKIGTGGSQTFNLAATDTTAALVAAKINATATDFTASDEGGYLKLSADASGDDLEVEAVANNAYTVLGFTVGVTDSPYTLKIKVGAGVSQTFELAETDITAVLVAAKINATANGLVASAVDGKVKLMVSDIVSDLEIEAVANDCYSVLGLTAEVTEPTAASHDAAAIAGLVIKLPDPCSVSGTVSGPFEITNGDNDTVKVTIGSGESQSFDLTAGENRTPTQICEDINATAVGFTAVPISKNRVQLVADSPWGAIEVEAVANDAYDTLGFTVGVVAAPTTIETLEK